MKEMAYIQERGDKYQVVTEQDYFEGGYAAKSFVGSFDDCVDFIRRTGYVMVPNSEHFYI